MFYSARQLEEIYKATGQIVLPYRAKLTPMAADWVRQKKIAVGYSDIPAAVKAQETVAKSESAPAPTRAYLWWCDGPCGAAKAALIALAKESPLVELGMAADAGQLVPAVKKLAGEVRSGRSAGGILVVASAAEAMVYANRCPSLRAVVGTCLDTVEQAIARVAANVLVIEHPYKTLMQMRNMMARFVKAPRELRDDVKKAISELVSCP